MTQLLAAAGSSGEISIGSGFAPDAARGRAIDARMMRELGASLDHVRSASEGEVDFDAGAISRLCAALSRGVPVAPDVFLRYYDLVEAIANDDAEAAHTLFAELAEAEPAGPMLEIVTLGDRARADGERYLRAMNEDETEFRLTAADPDEAQAFRDRLASGLALLDRHLPALAGEFRAIVRQLVICGSDAAMPMQLDGGSSLKLWGALFLNARFHADAVAVAEVLAHESAHSLLFGFCTEERLVRNDPDDRFPSPLRPDERPMDGIYHATYVSARMHWAMSRLAADRALAADDRARARAAADIDARNFADGYRVVAAHGELTKAGAALMADAKAYMDSAA